MSQERAMSVIIAIFLVVSCVAPARGQVRERRRAPAGKTGQDSSKPKVSPRQSLDDFWAAQGSIEAAIRQLEAYLRESPDGERAPTARRQVEALRSVSVTASRPEWVKMGQQYFRHVPVWRVVAADPQVSRVILTFEIACERDDGGDCYFAPFDRSPLVLIDNAGRHYPMLEMGDLPQDLRLNRDGTATISGGRTITVKVDFAPLPVSAVAGQVYYRDRNSARPARFSLTRRQ